MSRLARWRSDANDLATSARDRVVTSASARRRTQTATDPSTEDAPTAPETAAKAQPTPKPPEDREVAEYQREVARRIELRLEIAADLNREMDVSDAPKNDGIRRAKERQDDNEKHIQLLEKQLSTYLSAKARNEMHPTSHMVAPGSIVTLAFNGDTSDTAQYVITERTWDSQYETCGPRSPLGAAMLWKQVGNLIAYAGPNGRTVHAEITALIPGSAASKKTADDPKQRTTESAGSVMNSRLEKASKHNQKTGVTSPGKLLAVPREPRALSNSLTRQRRKRFIRHPHIAPINHLIDMIAEAENAPGLPYDDPLFGGVNAEMLFILKSPQADANPSLFGTRFLSLDNDDEGAENMFYAIADNNIDRSRCLAWNICPFPTIANNPSDAEISRAAPYTRQLIAMLPDLKVVVLLGGPAGQGWSQALLGGRRDVAVIRGASPSPPGIHRTANRASFEHAMRKAAYTIGNYWPKA
jgi:transcription elongation GreA/GreB family factor/uracil-DNA glycosylase